MQNPILVIARSESASDESIFPPSGGRIASPRQNVGARNDERILRIWKIWTPSRLFRLGAVAFCCAVAVFDLSAPPAQPPGLVFDGMSVIRGTVAGEVEQRVSSQRATLAQVLVNGHPTPARVLASFALAPALRPDDVVWLRCLLEKPQPIRGFAYGRYLAAHGVFAACWRPSKSVIGPPAHSTVAGALQRVKAWLDLRLQSAVPEPAASFLSGLVFGGSSSLSPDLQAAFSATGTSHVLAASGFNVSLLTAVFLAWAMEAFGRRRALVVTAVLLPAYAVMAGASASVLRAALMASVLLLGAWTRRQADAANLLLAAVVLLLVAQPRLLTDDPGFQLSVAATAALMAFAPSWEPHFVWLPKRFGIRASFVASLAASVATLPVSLWHFGTVSWIGPLANLLLLPFVPALVGLGLAAFAAAAAHPAVGAVAGLPAWAGAVLFLRAEQALASVPFAQTSVPHPHALAVAACLPIAFLVWRCVPRSSD